MIDKSELLRVPVFADLPDDQLAWFLSQTQEVHLKAGDIYMRVGEPAEFMVVILEGTLQVRGEINGETISIDIKAGTVTGVLPFSRMKKSTLTGRAFTESHVLRFPASLFPELVQRMPALTQRLVGLMSDRIRETTRIEQQKDRLAGLGKLSAGLAHELNNPASAAKRATGQLREILKRIRDASHELGRRELTPAQKAEIEKLEASFVQQAGPPADALTRLIPCYAVTGRATCGNWRPIWRGRTSSQRHWNRCSRFSTQTRPGPPWSESPLQWKWRAC
jgi:CRP-like cAMP-binding protein